MKKVLILGLVLSTLGLYAQQTIPLYKGEIPNSIPNSMKEIKMENNGTLVGYRSISLPTLAVYLPEASKTPCTAVIICPGGGYGIESYRLEGTIIANAFLQKGIAAFILKYRLPSDSIMIDKSIGPLQDAQQAIKTVKNGTSIPEKLGLWAFQQEDTLLRLPVPILKSRIFLMMRIQIFAQIL